MVRILKYRMAKLSFAPIAAFAILFSTAAVAPAFAAAPHEASFSARVPFLSHSSTQTDRSGLLASHDIRLSDVAFHEEHVDVADTADTAERRLSLVRTGEFPGMAGDPILVAQATDTRWSGEEWPWRRTSTGEYVAVSLAAATTAYFEIRNSREPGKARWKAQNGFDESIRDVMRLKSRSARDANQMASDAVMGLMIGAPIIETFATLGLRDARWDAQWQTQMINIESFALTSLVSSMMQNLLTRERPFVRNCRNGECEGDLRNRSMPSGHVAFAFTGAGLLCNHHKYQAIYDDPSVGRAICATGIGMSVLDGVLRLTSDRHYATDVAVGAVIGLFSGFALPRLLHYSQPQQAVAQSGADGDKPAFSLVSITPEILSGGAALSCDFRF
jgi:membrane-associated phospholipid phosphatase